MSVAVITGCSTGFGREAAERLAARGDRVFATMRGVEGKNSTVAKELSDAASAGDWDLRVIDLDVTSQDSVDAAADTVLEDCGAPDIVINNAGQMYMGFTEAFTADEFAQQLDVNVVGVHRVTRAFLPSMRAKESGLFINCSSIAGRIATPFTALYQASKWAIEAYSLGLRREVACTGVDIVVVEPGPFTTQLFAHAPGPRDEGARVDTYPSVARDMYAAFGAAFQGMFDDPDVPTEPSDVVDQYVRLIDMDPGTRPFRSVVGLDLGVAARNADDEKHDAPLLEMLEMTDFAALKH